MSSPYVGSMFAVAFRFAPVNFALCNGQVLSINSYTSLFSLLGTSFGGNGIANFGLPDLRGRTPIGIGTAATRDYRLGQNGGEETHRLTLGELPIHTHQLLASGSPASVNKLTNNSPAVAGAGTLIYGPPDQPTPMHNLSLAAQGGGTGHENRQPFLTINWVIATAGIFPSTS